MLVDTSVLVRTLQPHDPHFLAADRAIRLLPQRGTQMHIVPQSVYELWVVATRPIQQNGLGLTTAAVAVEVERLKDIFEFLQDVPTIYGIWEGLVRSYNVSGKPAYDARLVAAMLAHGITSILTFDAKGFERYEGMRAIHPADVIG